MVKNIALFLNSLGSGGAERVVSRISYELEKKYNVYIFLIENPRQFYKCAGHIVVIGGTNSNYKFNAMKAMLNINKYIASYEIECVISFLDVPNIINSVFNHRAKRIISIRDCSDKQYNFKQWVCRQCFNHSDAMVSVSKELNDRSIVQYKFDKKSAYTIENPYNVDEIKVLADSSIENEELKFINTHRTAIAVGRLDEQKGYDDLIEVFQKVIRKCPDAGLLILGEGDLQEELKKVIQNYNMQDSIKLLGVKKNPFAYMAKCDIYVSASKHEGFPNTLVEAMACGLPVISVDCMTGPREILADQHNIQIIQNMYAQYGIIVPSYTRNQVTRDITLGEFAKAWIRILNSEKTMERYKRVSEERARFYSMERCIMHYIDAIESTK